MPPCAFEILVLRHLNGEDIPNLSWGAAMSVAIEYLCGAGYTTRGYKITDKGRAFLAAKAETRTKEPCLHPHASFDSSGAYCPDCGATGTFPFQEVNL